MSRFITVITGGSTPERDVALAGAAQVVSALRSRGYTVRVVDTTHGTLTPSQEDTVLVPSVGREPPDRDELARLVSRELGPRLTTLPEVQDADLVFLILHGRQGEGGELQALLEMAGISYSGSGPLASALAMDKDMAKRLFRLADVPTPDWAMWPASETRVAEIGFPLIVKPSRVGSTVGLSVVPGPAELPAAVEEAGAFDDEIILERFVDGRELTVGVLGERPLAVGEIIPQHQIFDYECKYTPGMSQEIFPADIEPALADRVRELARRVHVALKLRDFSRVDFRLDEDETPVCLEANTLPGLTSASLMPKSAAAAGIGFADLCEQICEAALRRAVPRNKVRT